MAEDAKPAGTPGASDPSMEDILASIRRILNEDEPGAAPAPATPPAAGAPAPVAAADAPEAEAPLVLTEDMMVQPPPAPPPDPPAAPTPAPMMVAPPPQPVSPPAPVTPPPPPVGEGLLASATVAASAAALSQLMRAVNAQPAAPVYRSGGPSIEDVVREELRPMLKEWLDQHLPAVVERLVQAEIARVVGRSIP